MIQYCNLCGNSTRFEVPSGDSLPRHICSACGHIQYQNPRIIVGCIAEWEGAILMCRRAIEPRHGYWTLPAGFMENGESTAQAAARETHEEAGAHVIIDAPFAMMSIPHIDQVHLFYRGHMPSPDFLAGEESLEVSLLQEHQIPWDDLAFSSVKDCLERFFADRASGRFQFHETVLDPL